MLLSQYSGVSRQICAGRHWSRRCQCRHPVCRRDLAAAAIAACRAATSWMSQCQYRRRSFALRRARSAAAASSSISRKLTPAPLVRQSWDKRRADTRGATGDKDMLATQRGIEIGLAHLHSPEVLFSRRSAVPDDARRVAIRQAPRTARPHTDAPPVRRRSSGTGGGDVERAQVIPCKKYNR